MHDVEYSFGSVWHVPFPLTTVWREFERLMLADESAPWWPALRKVVAPERMAVGERLAIAVRVPPGMWLPMRMRIERVVPEEFIQVRIDGMFSGTGRMLFSPTGPESSRVGFLSELALDRWPSKILGAMAQPLLATAHESAMRRGEEGLRRHLALVH